MAFSEKYNLIHKGEIIDFFYTREEAEKMKVEYEMTFKSPIKIEYWFDEEAALEAEREYTEKWADNIDTNLL
jgi:hypothetical protein